MTKIIGGIAIGIVIGSIGTYFGNHIYLPANCVKLGVEKIGDAKSFIDGLRNK